jgi:hypothetical protein
MDNISFTRDLVDAAFRRLALLQEGETPLQDILDLADLARAASDEEGALLLYGAAALERGLSSPGVSAWLRDVASATGLWRAPNLVAAKAAYEPMLEHAIRELRTLLDARPSLTIDDFNADDALMRVVREETAPDDILATAQAIVAPLRVVLERQGEGRASILRSVQQACHGSTLPRPAAYAAVDVHVLARLVALRRIHSLSIFSEELDLVDPDLAVEAMALDGGGLGPMFANLPRLVQKISDLPPLLRLANRAPLAPRQEAAWLVALTVQAPRAWSADLARLLARRAGRDALRLLLRRGARRSDAECLWATRDAALLIGDGEIAAEAQRALVRNSPTNWSERYVLGDLLGLLGEVAEADQAFGVCMSLNPTRDLQKRRVALASGDFEAAARSSGFFAEPERAHLRIRPRPTFP